MTALAVFLPIVMCAVAVGLRLGRALGVRYADDPEAVVFGSALGLGVLSYAVLAFGSIGLLDRAFFAGVLVIGLVIGGQDLLTRGVGAWRAAWNGIRSLRPFERLILGAVAVVSFLSLCGALAPAIGQDELCYHLAQPRNYVRHGAVYDVPYSVNALWPFLMHMLFTLGELYGGAAPAKLFHMATYLLTGAAVACWVRRASGGRAAVLAGAAYLLMPGAFMQAGYAYIDNALALFVLLAVYAVSVYAESGERPWLALSGLCAGLAISTKLIGLFGIIAIVLLLLLRAVIRPSRRGSLLRDLMIFGLAVFAAGAIWYIRSWVLRGNPVFPFYPEFFGGNGWDDATYVDSHGRGQDVLSFLSLPWDLTLYPQWFGGEHIGPLFLAFLPGAVLLARTRAHIRRALGCAAVYAVLWFVVDPNVRFYYAGLALVAVGTGEAAAELVDSRDRKVGGTVRILVLAAALFSVGLACRQFAGAAVLLVRPSLSTAYLDERERSHAVAVAFAPHLTGTGDKILSLGEVRGYYFSRPFVLEGDFALFTHYGERHDTADKAVAYLRSLGFTHVLSSDLDGTADPLPPNGLYSMLRDPAVVERHFRVVARTVSHGIQYRLYRIKSEGER